MSRSRRRARSRTTTPRRVVAAVAAVAAVALASAVMIASFATVDAVAQARLDQARLDQARLDQARLDQARSMTAQRLPLDAIDHLRLLSRTGDAEVANELGNAYRLYGVFRASDEALARGVAHQARAARLNPLNGEHFVDLSWAYLQSDDLQRAADASVRALERNPNNVYYLFTRGRILEQQGRAEAAREVYARASSTRADPRGHQRLETLDAARTGAP